MQHLKDTICHSCALHHLDYKSRCEVILAVDTSVITVGYILSQEGDDRKRYLNQFGLISLTEVKSYYFQAKLELYRLFHALCTVCVSIFRVANFTVEMDAKYIKGSGYSFVHIPFHSYTCYPSYQSRWTFLSFTIQGWSSWKWWLWGLVGQGIFIFCFLTKQSHPSIQ